MQRQHKIIRLSLVVAALVAGADAGGANADPQSPAVSVVEHLHAQLIDVMQHADALGYAGRYRQLKPVIKHSFDLPALARLTVHGYWDKFSKVQQQEFVEDFSRLSIDTYASRFDGYNGEAFKTEKETESARGDHLVRTLLAKSDGDTVSLDYVLRSTDDGWRIINVVAQGVSDLALKRGQYTGVLKKQGVDGFMQRIKAQVERLPAVPE